MSYKSTNGVFYNISLLGTSPSSEDVDKHAPNKNINYLCMNFPGISTLVEGFSILNIGENDYILVDLEIPKNENWGDNYNLLNITPYFYTYNGENTFSSVNQTLQYEGKKTLKVCFTSSNVVAKKYLLKGYKISSIPVEYIYSSTYLILIRIGLINTNEFAEIPTTFKATYYKSSITTNYKEVLSIKYSTQKDILLSLPQNIQPIVGNYHLDLINKYASLKETFINLNYKNFQSYQFLSNIYKTTYPFKSFYDAITIYPYANMQLNNTCENYFNSDYILNSSFSSINEEEYFYILAVNQKRFGCGLTSSIELYNKKDNSSIFGMDTADVLPPLSSKIYPYTFQNFCDSYDFYLIEISQKDLLNKGIFIFYVVERLGYSPVNLNSCNYQYINSFQIYKGNRLDINIKKELKDKYDIYIGDNLL